MIITDQEEKELEFLREFRRIVKARQDNGTFDYSQIDEIERIAAESTGWNLLPTEPLTYMDKEKAELLLERKVLAAQSKEGLGYHGVLKGFDEEKGMFIVQMTSGDPNWDKKPLKWKWIVQNEK